MRKDFRLVLLQYDFRADRDFSLIFNEFSTFQAATQSLLRFIAAMLSAPLYAYLTSRLCTGKSAMSRLLYKKIGG